MMLLLDIGNTRVKWAWSDGEGLRDHGAALHDNAPAAALRACGLPKAGALWVSCVGAQQQPSLARDLEHALGARVQFARTEAQHDGLINSYAEPQRLGVDRWLAMLALWTQTRKPFCAVGAGTALTFDRVDREGRHLGGLIGPGLTSTQHTLLSVTNGRPKDLQRPYTDELGRDTESAVRQAALFASLGVVERGLKAPGADPGGARFITGGDAGELLPWLGPGWELRPHLVLEGLLALARSPQ